MKLGNAEFLGKITVNGTDYTIEYLAHILNNAMAYYSEKSYKIGDFVTYENKWYYSIVDNNKGNLPFVEGEETNAYWNEYASGQGAGGIENIIITENTTAEVQKRYVVNNISGVTITLPKGEETKTIAVAAQTLSDGASIMIRPATGDTIGGSDSLELDTAYSSVELVYLGSNWHIITPFMPQVISASTTVQPGIITAYDSNTRLASVRPVNVITNNWSGDAIQGVYADWSNPDEN